MTLKLRSCYSILLSWIYDHVLSQDVSCVFPCIHFLFTGHWYILYQVIQKYIIIVWPEVKVVVERHAHCPCQIAVTINGHKRFYKNTNHDVFSCHGLSIQSTCIVCKNKGSVVHCLVQAESIISSYSIRSSDFQNLCQGYAKFKLRQFQP